MNSFMHNLTQEHFMTVLCITYFGGLVAAALNVIGESYLASGGYHTFRWKLVHLFFAFSFLFS